MKRRDLLTGVGAAVATGIGGSLAADWNEWGHRANVFIAKAASYQADLERTIAGGLSELGWAVAWARGKTVLLKPNLVEPSRDAPEINTHPLRGARGGRGLPELGCRRGSSWPRGRGTAATRCSCSTSRGWARSSTNRGLEFVDLNHDEVEFVPNRLRPDARCRGWRFRHSLRRADLIVSLPKLKTHHWAGVTLSLKNLFGVMPGIVYGWPKNVLHYAGIGPSILDIAAAVRPHLAIVDGIVGMEGDGPIMGTPRQSGVLVMGTNLPAVDATCARLMRIDPWRVGYLAAASARLGPIAERHISQRGETIAQLSQPFQLLDRPWLAGPAGLEVAERA